VTRTLAGQRVGIVSWQGWPDLGLSLAGRMFDEAGYDLVTFGIVEGSGSRPPASDGSIWRLCDWTARDIVVVPGWPTRDVVPPPALAHALRAAYAQGARIIGLSTGVFVLAAAAVLDGHEVTTHWQDSTAFVQRFPGLRHRPHVTYIQDRNVFTCGGGLATVELLLPILTADRGPQLVDAIAGRWLMGPLRACHQRPAPDYRAEHARPDDRFADLLLWMTEHLDQTLTLDLLAARLHASPRTFLRQFRRAVGTTPHQWVLHQRVERARALLMESDLLVEQVALRCGFKSTGNFRAQFTTVTGLSPTQFRRQAQSKAS
jgi:transcriptional regulator GlxA family with amidase domain